MDDPTLVEPPTTRIARWFQPSPAELAGLAVLVLGAVVASALLWFQAAQRPPPSALVGSIADVGPAAASAGTAVVSPGAEVPDPPEAPPSGTAAVDGVTDLTVHVTGGVAAPGIVVVPPGSRVADAVAAAGGLDSDAEVERVNLARLLTDGEHVHLPRVGDEPGVVDPAPAGPAADGRVDINRADLAQLETLPGVGPARARAIVAHREEHGPFTVPGDLRGVSGIGEVTFQQLAEFVVVG